MDEILTKIKERADQVKEYAKKFGKKTVDKTNTVVSQTKLKMAIGKTEDKIKEILAEIGGNVYKSYTDGDSAPDVSEQCKKLDELYKEIEDLNEQFSEISNSVKCESCGTNNKAGSAYCSKCGAKLSEENTAQEASEDFIEEVVEAVTPED